MKTLPNSLYFLFIFIFASIRGEVTLDNELKEYIHINADGINKIGLISVGGHENEINQATWLYIKNALEYYRKSQPLFIILELNTPGGEVFAAQKISDALKEMDIQFSIPIVAFINNWAISAGAMLAYSCRFITIVKDASMGAAEPLSIEGNKMETASEKVNSAIRADFANRAQFYGRNPYIAEAMVDKDIILIQRQGKIIKVDAENQIISQEPDPDILIKPKGKLLTLTAEQMMKFGVANTMLLPAKLDQINTDELTKGQWPARKSLLFTHPFFAQIPEAIIDEFKLDWKGRFFAFLSNPAISSLLFLGMIMGFYIEVNTPGFGVAGTVAVTCLFLIIVSSFALEIANWLEVIFIITGILIILVELFVLPTFGLLGFIGIIAFLAGLFGMMLPGVSSINYEFDTKTFNAAGEVFFERLGWLSGTLILAFIFMALLSRYILPNFNAFRRFVLAGNEQEGYLAVDKSEDLPLPGTEGMAFTTLRPSGKIIISDKIYDAVSYGSFIEKGAAVIVQRIEGSSIVVKLSENQNI